MFAFTLDALIACGAAWTLALIAQAIASRHRPGSRLWLLGGGLVMGLTSFLSIGALATGAIVALALLFAAWRERENWIANGVRGLALFAGGFMLAWLLLMLIFPMQPLVIFHNAMDAHRAATLSHRGFWPWVWLNIVCFAPFCGWPVVTACLASLKSKVQSPKPGDQSPQSQDPSPKSEDLNGQTARLIGGATLAAILLLSMTGNVRGEVERLWLFLVPPLCALAAAVIEPSRSTRWLPLLVLQTAQGIFMAAGLAPLVKPI